MKYPSSVMLAGLIALAFTGSIGDEMRAVAPAETQVGAQDAQKAILVTGASSGIGRKITEHLAARGYFVYAGARSEEDLRELNTIENVQSIRLDVTIQEEIDAAQASLVVANDSGAMHLAAELGAPTLGLFGATDPAHTGPLGASAVSLRERVVCSPCGLRECNQEAHHCMIRLAPEAVLESCVELLAAGAACQPEP